MITFKFHHSVSDQYKARSSQQLIIIVKQGDNTLWVHAHFPFKNNDNQVPFNNKHA